MVQNVYSYPSKKATSGVLWRARYRSPGHKIIEKRGFSTADAAEAWLISEKAKLNTGEWTDPRKARKTVGHLAPAWLSLKKATLKPSSYTPLEASWRNYVEPRWGKVELRRIVNSEVAAWVSGIGKSPTVAHRAYGVLNGILEQAVQDGRLARNPAANIKNLPSKKVRQQHRYLTPGELHRVADASGSNRALVLTLGYCGLRWGETIALRASDIDLSRRRISVHRNAVEVGGEIHEGTPKTKAGARLVPVPKAAADALATLIEDKDADDLVFPSPTGGYMKRVRASTGSKSWWKNALKTAGVENMVLHDLRHTAASIAVSAGGNVKAIQRMLGHESAAMTLDVYSDLFDDDIDALLNRIDSLTPAQVGGKTVADGNGKAPAP
ncbi:hypothetical protein ABE10_11055 [Bacillus toyonensis]|nr:hypothetical protein [Bacillus toyonensis]